MRKCPNCARVYGPMVQVCPVCRSILAQVVDDDAPVAKTKAATEEPVFEPADTAPSDEGRKESWTCLQCKQSVPGTFDVCWSCGAGRDGTPDPEFKAGEHEGATEMDAAKEQLTAGAADTIAPKAPASACPQCGSTKMMPGVDLFVPGTQWGQSLFAVVYGDPQAILLKDRRLGRMSADICGECGHVELRVEDPAALYQHYLLGKSRRYQGNPSGTSGAAQ